MSVLKVLLIDDDPDIRKITALAMKRVAKWEVEVAASGPEGLSVVREVDPDVILLDVMMPGMDGPTVLKELKRSALTAHIPVIFLTAKIQRDEVDQYMSMGVVGVLKKPFNPLLLPAQIRQLLDQPEEVAVS
ncbi:MAG: response regulator [Candidatus Obscuribacterales bacterium]|nr:response regulator [Candidatus Obscuribacterales bacterium]